MRRVSRGGVRAIVMIGCMLDGAPWIGCAAQHGDLAREEQIDWVPVPIPAPEEPQVGDPCDDMFSLEECKDGQAGITPCNNGLGVCWSEGPQLGDKWDCNHCI